MNNTINSHRLSSSEALSLKGRRDILTYEEFESGMIVVVCKKCKTIHLESTWREHPQGSQCYNCKCTETTAFNISDFSDSSHIQIKKSRVKIKKSSKRASSSRNFNLLDRLLDLSQGVLVFRCIGIILISIASAMTAAMYSHGKLPLYEMQNKAAVTESHIQAVNKQISESSITLVPLHNELFQKIISSGETLKSNNDKILEVFLSSPSIFSREKGAYQKATKDLVPLNEEQIKEQIDSYNSSSVDDFFYYDYDLDGLNEAFGIISNENGEVEQILFSDSYGTISNVSIPEKGAYYTPFYCKESDYKGVGFFAINLTFGGSAGTGRIYGVKSGNWYELDVSGKYDSFSYEDNELKAVVSVFGWDGKHKSEDGSGHFWIPCDMNYDSQKKEFSVDESPAIPPD